VSDRARDLETTLSYHARTKHRPFRYARGPGELDWGTQPHPFRRYLGAEAVPLALVPAGDEPCYEPAFVEGRVPAAPLDAASVAQLFFDALGLSAWKRASTGERWSLRTNPSSGNLHPTEAYLVCGKLWPSGRMRAMRAASRDTRAGVGRCTNAWPPASTRIDRGCVPTRA
jgi:hypothetical protein